VPDACQRLAAELIVLVANKERSGERTHEVVEGSCTKGGLKRPASSRGSQNEKWGLLLTGLRLK
jgi:hypothetical protein